MPNPKTSSNQSFFLFFDDLASSENNNKNNRKACDKTTTETTMAAMKTDTNMKKNNNNKINHKRDGGGMKESHNKTNVAVADGSDATAAVSKTRVCIRNLPPSMTTEVELKDYLLQNSTTVDAKNRNGKKTTKIQITDCKILKSSKTGKSRNVAFVGFKDEEQASFVIQQFDRTYMKSCRIMVVPALLKQHPQRQPNQDRNNISPQDQGDDEETGTPSSGKSSTDNTKKDKVKEFLEEIDANKASKSKFWQNDGIDTTNTNTEVSNHDDHQDHDDNSTTSSSSSSSSSSDSDSSSDNEDFEETNDDHSIINAGTKKSNSRTASTSDLDFLRSKQRSVDNLDLDADGADDDIEMEEGDGKDANDTTTSTKNDGDDDDDNKSDSEASSSSDSSSSSSDDSHDDHDDGKPQKAGQGSDITSSSEKNRKTTLPESESENKDNNDNDDNDTKPSSRLFVRNLPFETTEEELEDYFSALGTVVECHIPVDDQHRNKGYAFVTYESPLSALRAQKELDNIDFQGRLLQILPAHPPPGSDNQNHSQNGPLSWKQKQELARKEKETKTGADSKSWSTTFVRGDAVVDNLAERLGLRKGDLLGVKDKLSSGDAAVRLALGETKIIEENREYFRSNGVDMDNLVSSNLNDADAAQVQRSRKDILVKNLPFDTRVEELTKLFHVGNASFKILLPPSRTIALIQYGHPNDAKKAFRRLAYRRFKHVPIYLEWAPMNAKEESQPPEEETRSMQQNEDPMVSPPTRDTSSFHVNDREEEEEVTSTFESASVYVKNLNFRTSEEQLRSVFEEKVGPVVSIRIPRKVAPMSEKSGIESVSLSMGYGFVELPSHQIAKKAVKQLQDVLIDGHNLELAISAVGNRGGKKSPNFPSASTSGKSQTKIMVRNVPFQATRTDILKLFGSFGQLKKVRLPKKFDGTHRGFAFVDFLTAKEAQAAMDALSRTHLFGRHLVMEWASADTESVEGLRKKAMRDVGGGLPPDVQSQQQPQNKKIRFT